jgi:hypothetical protein
MRSELGGPESQYACCSATGLAYHVWRESMSLSASCLKYQLASGSMLSTPLTATPVVRYWLMSTPACSQSMRPTLSQFVRKYVSTSEHTGWRRVTSTSSQYT